MKRSEMIKVIIGVLPNMLTEAQSNRLARNILFEIEGEGMLPPLDRESYDTLEWGTSILTYHDWETEDE
jgi:hypothetical protein